jgi:hypothetical protein
MILLSHQGWSAATIAELLGCDPRTVRRWVHRYNTHGAHSLADRPRPGRPRLGSPRLGDRIRRLLAQPRAWTIPLLHRYLGRPAISLHTLHRRVREVAAWRRPRLVATGDPDRDQVLAALRQQLNQLPEGVVVLAEDETHLQLLRWVRATWVARGTRQRVMTPAATSGGPSSAPSTCTAADSSTRSAARRSAPTSPRSASTAGRLPDGAGSGGGLRQRHHPPLQDRPGMAGIPPAGAGAARGPLQPPRQPGRAHLGCPQGLPRQLTDADHGRADPPSPCLLPSTQPHPAAGHRRPHSSPWLPDQYGQNFREAA